MTTLRPELDVTDPLLVVFDAPDDLVVRRRLCLQTVWLNEGGRGAGLIVTIEGPALDLVDVTHVLVGKQGRRVDLVDGTVDATRVRYCTVDDVVLEDHDSQTPRHDGLDQIAVMVVGRAKQAGLGSLTLTVACRDSEEAEPLIVQLDVRP